jgi:hypothetical protein
MCKFFSLVSDGKGKIYYFDWELRKKCLKKEIDFQPDSHTSIADYYGFKGKDEDKLNKYEYNPLNQKFTIDQLNVTDDSKAVEIQCKKLKFKNIVKPLVIKPIIHPLRLGIKKPTKADIRLLQQWASVWASVRASTGAFGDSVGDSVWDSVRDSVRASVRDFGHGQHDANWLGFHEFFKQECGLDKETDKLTGLWNIAKNGGWFLAYENICFVCERHNILKRDERGRLHCEDGMAVAYPDGWGVYAWHGTRIPGEWIEDKSSLTPTIALHWSNAEQRRAACEIIGWDNILSAPELNPKVIDVSEPHIGTLIEVDLPDAPKQRFLKYQCGTGRAFAEPVTPHYNTALEANAAGNGWRGKGNPMYYIPFIRT